VAELDRRRPADGPRHLLFLDADLGATAGCAGPLIGPVATGEADMTVAVFANRVKLGGHGFVVRLAGSGIRRATGWTPAQPLNGQRCLTRAAFEAARPLARGFGVETGMTIDLMRRGMRVVEVEVEMAHRVTGTDLPAQLHRARQFADVGLALATRLRLRGLPGWRSLTATMGYRYSANRDDDRDCCGRGGARGAWDRVWAARRQARRQVGPPMH
jgi:hypothetical protein